MRKMLIAAAALLFCASPAAAQQLRASHDATPLAAAETREPKAEPSLYPTTDQVKADVRTNEARRAQQDPMGSKSWWYLVAAIAVGVIIAAVVL